MPTHLIDDLFQKAFPKTSLRTVLITLLVGQILVVVSLIGYLSINNSRKAVHELIDRYMIELGDRIEERLERFVTTPNKINQLNAQALDAGQWNIWNLQQLEKVFWEQSKVFDEISYIQFGRKDGEFVGLAVYDDKILNYDVTNGTGDRLTYGINSQGNRDKLLSVVLNYDPRKRPWYTVPKEANKPAWTPVYTWVNPPTLAITLGQPYYDQSGEFQGILATDLTLNNISQFLRTLNISELSRVFIVNDSGELIATSSKQIPFRMVDGRPQILKTDQFEDPIIQATAQYLNRKFKGLSRLGTGQPLHLNIAGKPQLVQVSPFRDQFGLSWSVVTVVPQAELMARINANTRHTVILALFTVAIAILMSILIARWLSRPIRKLSQASQSIAAGHFQQKVEVTKIEELKILADSFNQMATKLEQSFEKLEAQNNHLKQLDVLKDEFLANTSHELLTPLNGMLGISESMLEGATGELSEIQRKNLLIIVNSGERLVDLIQDILDFSKLKHQSLQLDCKPIELKVLVEIVVTLSKSLIGNKDLKLINAIPAELPLVYADENRLQQILHNLIGNAIKFTASGTITIAAEVMARQKMVRLSVTDTGIGIAPERLEQIFQPFEQADGSIVRRYGGTGLGLTIAQQLVTLHGGTIEVQSELNQGTCFAFTLPLSEIQDLRTTQPKLAIKPEKSPSVSLSSAPSVTLPTSKDSHHFDILIVDDEPVNLQVLNNHLAMENYTVTQTSSGEEALALIDSGEMFDLIILDVMMPKMSGYEVCEKIRQKYPSHQLPVVMLTAKNQVSDLVTGFEFGANDYLTKPFSKDELLTRIKSHINLAKTNQAYERFVPHEYLNFLDKDSIVDVFLGDHVSKEMAVLFSDIRSFTALSETMTAQENFNFVNAYFRRISPIIREHHGFIVKYLGDGMMAVFPEGSEDALRAGIAKLEAVAIYNQARQTIGYQPIQIGVGVHVGHMMVGMVGEHFRMQGDAFSDNVNLTARLEGLTKFYGIAFIVSEQVLATLPNANDYQVRWLDRVIVKGRNEPITIYEVLDGQSDKIRQLKLETQSDFESAISFYQSGHFVEAKGLLASIQSVNPGDRVVAIYLERVNLLLNQGTPGGWDGIWRFPEK